MKPIAITLIALLVVGCSGVDYPHGNNNNGPCGNGAIDPGEQCDGTNFGMATCQSLGNYVSGVLHCSDTCTFDVSTCTPPEGCGNGDVDGAEDCDGSNLDDQTCGSVGNFTGGTLGCQRDCTFDTSRCTKIDPVCGNDTKELGEECDGQDFGGASCADYGHTGGTLSCNDCTVDTSECTDDPQLCGNNAIDPGEQCDGPSMAGLDCTTIGQNFVGGTLSCASDCTFDTSACVAGVCGDGTVSAGEQCDGTNLDGQDCTTVAGGFIGGQLACSGCQFNSAGCVCPATEQHCSSGCADTTNDMHNCGGCSVDCAVLAPPGTSPADCSNGHCTYQCAPGYVDLDGDLWRGTLSNGCEYQCTPTNGGVEICDGLDNDCDGTVDNNLAYNACPLFEQCDVAPGSPTAGQCVCDSGVRCGDGHCIIEGTATCGQDYPGGIIENCGGCGVDCGSGERCGASGCFVPPGGC